MRGLGINSGTPYELTPDQLLDLETRNPTAAGIIEGNNMWGSFGVPVNLSTGYSFTDDTYGNVLISTDAQGRLHVIGNSTVSPDIINAPPYVSPSGNSIIQSFEDFLTGMTTYGKLALLAVGGYFLYQMVRK